MLEEADQRPSKNKTDIYRDLFDSDGWDGVDFMFSQFYLVKFKKDFGNFKKGSEHACLAINIVGGVMQSYDENGEVLISQKITIKPIEE